MMANYSHLVSNLIYIYLAIYWKVTVFSFYLICSICLFYALLTFRIGNVAIEIYKHSGLLEQTDLKMAGIITKKFNQRVQGEFISLRSKFWRWQMNIFVVCVSLGFATTLIYRERDQLNS